MKRRYNTTLVILAILLVEGIALKLLVPRFITPENAISLARQSSITAIVAIAMGMVLISGGIDLSLGAQISLSGMVISVMMIQGKVPIAAALLFAVILGSAMGFLNGLICAKVRIHPFILTMAMSVVYRGLAKVVNRGMPLYGLPVSFLKLDKLRLLGIIPQSLLTLLCCLGAGYYILRKTYLGKYIYAIGIDERTAGIAGINTKQVKWTVYGLAGLLCGIASVLLLSKVGSAQPNAMTGIELEVLVAAAIGGIGFKGGKGNLLNIVLGVFILELFGDALIIFGVGEYFRSIFKGIVLLTALLLDDFLSP